jgi:uncharacterized protein (DUF1810 family)
MPPRTKRATPTSVRQAKQRVTRARHRYQRSRTRKNGRAFRSALGALVALVGLGAAMAFVTKPRQVRNTHSPAGLPSRPPANTGAHAKYDPADPYDIRRFIVPHKTYFATALKEIRAGEKKTHWSWYIFPTPPHIVKGGKEIATAENKKYALRDTPTSRTGYKAAKAYIQFGVTDGINLRQNYITIMEEITTQLNVDKIPPNTLVGHLDVPKLVSSLKLFKKASADNVDPDVHAACENALNALKNRSVPV